MFVFIVLIIVWLAWLLGARTLGTAQHTVYHVLQSGCSALLLALPDLPVHSSESEHHQHAGARRVAHQVVCQAALPWVAGHTCPLHK